MRIVNGIIRGNTVLVDDDIISRYEGERVTVMLPGVSAEENARVEKRLRYLSGKAEGRELTARTAEEIDRTVRELRENDRV